MKGVNKLMVFFFIFTIMSCEIKIRKANLDLDDGKIWRLVDIRYKGKDITKYFAGDVVTFDYPDGIFPNMAKNINNKRVIIHSSIEWASIKDSLFIKSKNDILAGRYKVSYIMDKGRKYLKFHSKDTDIILYKVYDFKKAFNF